MTSRRFIAAVLFAACIEAAYGCGKYTLVAPKVLRVGAEETLYLKLENCDIDYIVIAELVSLPTREQIHSHFEKMNHNFGNPIPIKVTPLQESIEKYNGYDYLKVEVQIKWCRKVGENCGGNPWIRTHQNFILNMTSGYVFVKTDRPAYKPGETVKIAIASLNDKLLLNQNNQVQVIIRTPEEFGGVDIWADNIQPKVGQHFINIEKFKIPDQPMKGTWTIDALVNGKLLGSASFWVDKYVLPTFKVKVKMDKYFILPMDQAFRGTIDAEYSFGEPVPGYYYIRYKIVRKGRGEVTFAEQPSKFSTLSLGPEEPFSVFTGDLLTFLHQTEPDITLRDLADEGATMKIEVLVTAHAESKSEGAIVSGILFTTSPYEIDTSRMSKFFMPGVVLPIKARILDVVSRGPLSGVDVTISVAGGIEKQVVSDKNGEVYSEFDSIQDNSIEVTIRTLDDSATSTTTIESYSSPTDKYLGLSVTHKLLDVGQQQFLQFRTGTTLPSEITYFVVARGKIVLSKTKKTAGIQNANNEFSDNFEVTSQMVPSARVVAYYNHDNQISSNSVWFDVKNTCQKPVLTVIPDKDAVAPSQKVTFSLTGPANGVVQTWGVDRSAYYVYNESRLTRDFLWEEMSSYDVGCSLEGGPNNMGVFDQAGLQFLGNIITTNLYNDISCHSNNENNRKKRSPVVEVTFEKISEIEKCEMDGKRSPYLTCEKRLKLLRKSNPSQSCQDKFMEACNNTVKAETLKGRSYAAAALGRSINRDVGLYNQQAQQKRFLFHENWIWLESSLNEQGRGQFVKNALHTITTFDVGAFGVGSDKAFCVAEPTEVTVSKLVFIKLDLPYSVKLHEQTTIRYTVHNFHEDGLRLIVNLHLEDELCTKFGKIDRQTGHNLDDPSNLEETRSGKKKVGSFSVLPISMPDGVAAKKTTITMKVYSYSGLQPKLLDHISKDLLIEKPGKTFHKSQTFILEQDKSFNFTFDIAERREPNSAQCRLSFYANALGPYTELDPITGQLNDMSHLIRQPGGCGEQNMLVMGPNIFVHKYRNVKDIVTPAQETKMREFIKKGYAIELGWRTKKANYEAFATWDYHPPSIWLNGYVIKVFSMAKDIAGDSLNIVHICTALKWVLRQQHGDGHFTETQSVVHKEMDGGVVGDVTLTAYMIISIQETMRHCPDVMGNSQSAIEKGTVYLNRQRNVDLNAFSTALITYALALAEPYGINTMAWREKLVRKIKIPVNNPDLLYIVGPSGEASNIETTAYAVLAELAINRITTENHDILNKLRKWLLTQRNERGGFKSTQDTVMALQALTKYQEIYETTQFRPDDTNLMVTLTSLNENAEWEPQEVNVVQSNENIAVKVDIPAAVFNNHMDVAVEGVGEGTMSYQCSWNEVMNKENSYFKMDILPVKVNTKKLKLTVIATTRDPDLDHSNRMTMMEIGIPSGFIPEEDSVQNLNREHHMDGIFDHYKITESMIILYLSGVPTEGVEVPGLEFKIENEVNNPAPVPVTVYDYYEPERTTTTYYDPSAGEGAMLTTTGCEEGGTCRCAEGQCPKCRTREEQLHNTTCITDRCGTCDYANDLATGCYELKGQACKNEYVHIITVHEILDNSDDPRFFKFMAFVNKTLKEGRNPVPDNLLELRMRQNCYATCDDEAMEERRKQANAKVPFISEGRHLLLQGTGSEKEGEKLVYYLDSSSVLEVVPSTSKCRLNRQKLKRGRGSQKKQKLCEMKKDLSKALDNCG